MGHKIKLQIPKAKAEKSAAEVSEKVLQKVTEKALQ
jgi:hypothetical protein